MVIIEINNVLSRIIGTLQPEIVLSLKEACAYSIQGAEHSVYGQRIYCPVCKKQTKEATTEEIFSDAYPKDGQLYRKCYIHGWVNPISLWDGRNFLFNTRGLSFPTGIISRVITILQNANVQYTLKDVRLRPYVLPIQWHGPVLRYYQEEAVNEILKRTRGVIQAATGCGKCFREDQDILMFDGSIKKVSDIRPGDKVMGIDGKYRTVEEVHTGEDLLYKVEYRKAGTYYVTKDHILTLKVTGMSNKYDKTVKDCNGNKYRSNDIVDISVEDFIRSSNSFKHVVKGFYGKAVKFYKKQSELPVDPYFLGIWLGDGYKNSIRLSTMEPEVINYIKSLETADVKCTERQETHADGTISKARTVGLSRKKGRENTYLVKLKELNVINNKHIPDQYLYASYKDRCSLLAGILDSDGYTNKGTYEIVQKNKRVADQICFLARSVGLYTAVKEKIGRCQTGKSGLYYRIHISGNFDDIPFKVSRRIPLKKTKYNNEQRLFGVSVCPDKFGRFYGFSVKEKDKHFLLGDFAVAHNSNIIAAATAQLGVTTLVLTHTKAVFNQVHESLKNNLKMHIGVIGDGKFEPGRITVAMPQSLTETTTVLKKKIVKGVWKNVATKVQRVKPKVEEYLCGVEALFVDETHRLSANSCQLVANACTNAFYRVGVSATPWRDDMLDILIEAATGRVIYKYSATQAIQDKYLAKPVIHMVNFRQEKQPRKIWKDVLNKKTKQFEKKYVDFEYADLYNKCVTENEERNKIIEKIVRERYALGESILVIVKHLQHGENLHKLLRDLDKDVRYVNGEDDQKFLQETLDDLDKKRIKVCIATGIFSEGVDVRYLNTVINTTAMDSSVNAMQVVGRALRKVPGKELVNIYDIADTNVRWLEQHAKNRRKIYQTEPGYDIIEE